MTPKFTRVAVAGAAALALAAGSMGVAGAQLGSSEGATLKPNLSTPQGPSETLGEVGGIAWKVELNTALHNADGKVAPGQTFKVRVNLQGINGETRIDEIRNFMPEGFTLEAIERMGNGPLGGTTVHTFKDGEYGERVVGGQRIVNVIWKEGGFLGAFESKPTVSAVEPLSVDFTWRAPQTEGAYSYGAGLKVGAVMNNNKDFTAKNKIIVEKGASGSSNGSSDWSSLSSS